MNQKQIVTLIIIAAVAGVILFRDRIDFGGEGGGGNSGGGGGDNVETVFVEPSGDLRQAVQRVRDVVQGKNNLLGLAWFYYRMSVVQKDTPQTTEQARMIHKTAGDELARVAGGVAYQPELETIVEQLFEDYVGLEPKKLNQSDRDKISDLFAAIAWAIYAEADGKISVVSLEDGTQLVCTDKECFIDAPSDFAGDKLPDYFVNGLVEDPADDEIRTNLQSFYPTGMPLKGGRQDGDRGPPGDADGDDVPIDVDTGEPYQMGLMFDPDELRAWNETGLMMSDVPLTSGKGETRLLFKGLQQFDPLAYTQERQTTGDCTSHAFRNACDTSRAFEILINDDPEDFVVRGATEAIYGYRGHSGQGMSPFRAAQFVSQHGGVMLRRAYGDIDASRYNANLGINWGRRGGPPSELVQVLQRNQMQKAALVSSVTEARDAIYNGYALAVGSDFGFESGRDQYGFASKKGSWNHCMAWVAVSTAYELAGDNWQQYGNERDSPCFLIVNSWGEWNGGPTGKYNIPKGSFWITERNAASMIGQRMSFAVGEFNGFASRPLTDWGFAYLGNNENNRMAGDPSLNGVVEQSVGVVLELYEPDPTRPNGGDRDDDDNGPAPTPNSCSRCNGSGFIRQGDGHRSDCPGEQGNGYKCPFVSAVQSRGFMLAA